MSCVCCSSFLRMNSDHCQGKILEQRDLQSTLSLTVSGSMNDFYPNTLPWPQRRARGSCAAKHSQLL